MVIGSKVVSLRSYRSRILIVSLIVVVVLLVSLLAYQSLVVTNGSVRVKNAAELRDAVNKAEVGVHVDIVLTKDISLGPELTIPAGADITLKSAGGRGFFRLIGLDGQNVITIMSGGRLTLDGIIVMHENGDRGLGVSVFGGTLIMVNGEISGNTDDRGGGVNVSAEGVFEFVGGVISGNAATWGGGVYNWGTFEMYGGKISGNTATLTYAWAHNGGYGGGVYMMYGSFSMSGGEISGNTALQSGGGVYIDGTMNSFERLGGEISGNTANIDNDVGNGTE